MKQWMKTKLIQFGLRNKNVKFGKKTVIGLQSDFADTTEFVRKWKTDGASK